jgi:hypothetical protein
MTDPASSVNTADDIDAQRSTTSYPGTPRWVKVGRIVALLMIVLVVLVMVMAGGEHGPMRHIPSAGGTNTIATIAVRL